MKKISRSDLKPLKNMEAFQLIADILAYLAGKDVKTLLIDQSVEVLTRKNQVFDDALVEENKLKNPRGMDEVDSDRDAYISKLYNGLKFFADKYPVPARAEAAQRLLEIVVRHGGVKIAYMTQALESGVLTNLEQELTIEPSTTDLKTVALDDLATLLFAANNEFVNYKQTKDQTQALLTMGITKEARNEMEIAFAALCERINALALINGEEPYAEIIDTINHTVKTHVDGAKLRSEQTKKRKDKKSETTDEAES